MFKLELFRSDPDPYFSLGSDPVNHFATIMSLILDPDLSVSGHVLGKGWIRVFFLEGRIHSISPMAKVFLDLDPGVLI